jgi:hypothetical protein
VHRDRSNDSKLPLKFRWRLPAKYSEQLQVIPETGSIPGNATFDTLWTFAPRSSGAFEVKVPIEVFPCIDEAFDGSVAPLQRATATVISEGTTGALLFNPPAIDFGCALVGSVTRVPLMLENRCDAAAAAAVAVAAAAAAAVAAAAAAAAAAVAVLLLLLLCRTCTSAGGVVALLADHHTRAHRCRSDCSLSFKIEAVIEEEVAGMDLDNDGIIELHELKAYQARKVPCCREQRG